MKHSAHAMWFESYRLCVWGRHPSQLICVGTDHLLRVWCSIIASHYSYARTSTIDQIAGFEAQIKALRAVSCEKLFQEQVSSVGERQQLAAVLEYVREGDVLVVTKLDRLARSVADLMTTVQTLDRKSVALRVLNLGMDTHTPTGKLMLTVLGGVAQFEREMMLERQREGVAKAAGRRDAVRPHSERRSRHRPSARPGRGDRLPHPGRCQGGRVRLRP